MSKECVRQYSDGAQQLRQFVGRNRDLSKQLLVIVRHCSWRDCRTLQHTDVKHSLRALPRSLLKSAFASSVTHKQPLVYFDN